MFLLEFNGTIAGRNLGKQGRSIRAHASANVIPNDTLDREVKAAMQHLANGLGPSFVATANWHNRLRLAMNGDSAAIMEVLDEHQSEYSFDESDKQQAEEKVPARLYGHPRFVDGAFVKVPSKALGPHYPKVGDVVDPPKTALPRGDRQARNPQNAPSSSSRARTAGASKSAGFTQASPPTRKRKAISPVPQTASHAHKKARSRPAQSKPPVTTKKALGKRRAGAAGAPPDGFDVHFADFKRYKEFHLAMLPDDQSVPTNGKLWARWTELQVWWAENGFPEVRSRSCFAYSC